MKKLAVVLLCIGLISLSAFAQSGRASRPRIVTTPTPNVSQNDTTQDSVSTEQNQTKRPPVLLGDTKTSTTTTSQPDNTEATSVDGDDVIRVETNLVTIPVSVLDRNGRFISGLRQSDFQIFEDGVQQKIEYFAPVEQPFTVILLIDVSPSTSFRIDEIQNAAITFVNQLRQEDRVIVMAFNERVHVLSPPTNNRAILSNAIRQTSFGDGTSLYDAVYIAISQQLRQIQGRKAVVLFTDGVDTTSRRANYQSTVLQAEELDAMIYPIRYDTAADMAQVGGSYPYPGGRGGGASGTLGAILGGILSGGNVRIGNGGGYPRGRGSAGGSNSEYETGNRYLEALANASGGRKFEARSIVNVDAAFSGIAEELRRQYAIGYYPEKIGEAGQRKQIKVRANRTEAVVRSKNSYIVGSAGAGNTAAKSPVKQAPKINSNRLPF
jgi:Ca-activated chloride channel homolog